jgi:HEAT repeat protein
VALLVGDDGPLSAAAGERLVARGRDAIPLLETGLYTTDSRARRRVVEALRRIADPEAIPILEHLARRDPDPEIREAAGRAAAALTPR